MGVYVDSYIILKKGTVMALKAHSLISFEFFIPFRQLFGSVLYTQCSPHLDVIKRGSIVFNLR